jgi:adenylate cyclase
LAEEIWHREDQDHWRCLHGGWRVSITIENNYSKAIADLALAMRDLLRRDFTINDMQLEVRIGIGTGPVVAGVVGKKKFIYDLWGDTVNLASRITSEGVPGMVQVDETTHRRLAAAF